MGYNYLGAALNNFRDISSLKEDTIRMWLKLIYTNNTRPGCVYRGPCQCSTRANDVERLTACMYFRGPCQWSTRSNDVERLTAWMGVQGALSVVNSLKRCRTTHELDVFSEALSVVNSLKRCRTTHGLDVFSGALSVVNSLKQCRTTHILEVFSGGLVSRHLAQTM